MELAISQLVEYAVRHGLIEEGDRVWAANRLLEALGLEGFQGLEPVEELPPLQDILDVMNRYAYEHGLIQGDTPSFTDLYDTGLMGLLTPRPSETGRRFWEAYRRSPEEATDWYYTFSGDTNYIRRDRIAKDVKWPAETEYGTLDITINLSKPEKDPRAIAAAGKAVSVKYPKCLLCVENEGYAGRLDHPARQNHRVIPLKLAGEDYCLQYSPYVYYNEHCIVFNRQHIPMAIDRRCFDHLLEFVTVFPHYFVGSNADLPIVGGSVLSHDHYQGGRYTFAMERAPVETEISIPGYGELSAGIVRWPMSVIRLRGADPVRVADCCEHILNVWRGYSDPAADILAETDAPHNTITPICRRRGEDYEMDLVLRNNRTTEAYPLGIFHPHQEKHHIKKENIGLIEVMGLAVLPARLKEELAVLEERILTGGDLEADPRTASHAAWTRETVMGGHPELNADNCGDILRLEVGKVFAAVLEDAGVYKRTEQGREAFLRFVAAL
ncbi:MAG: UDP-glucose--hexose-1-phosphate uridylyltransferase [Clostridiales bacterium]|nr:UDP-glucose--hexose-1-phosphate uridylyltransferase [Clostridiales bacterium]